MGIYFTVADFEPFHRSSINNLQLIMLCKETDFKSFGPDTVFSRMLSDLRQLEDHGLVTTAGHAVRATVITIVGDKFGVTLHWWLHTEFQHFQVFLQVL